MFHILSNCILSQFLSSYRIKFPLLVLETCSQSSFWQGTVRYWFQGFLELEIAMQILLTEMLSNSYLNYDRANCYTINFNEFQWISIHTNLLSDILVCSIFNFLTFICQGLWQHHQLHNSQFKFKKWNSLSCESKEILCILLTLYSMLNYQSYLFWIIYLFIHLFTVIVKTPGL